MPASGRLGLMEHASTGDTFYVIEDGTFVVFNKSGAELARVGKGSCFGELALLNQVSSHPARESGNGKKHVVAQI